MITTERAGPWVFSQHQLQRTVQPVPWLTDLSATQRVVGMLCRLRAAAHKRHHQGGWPSGQHQLLDPSVSLALECHCRGWYSTVLVVIDRFTGTLRYQADTAKASE